MPMNLFAFINRTHIAYSYSDDYDSFLYMEDI